MASYLLWQNKVHIDPPICVKNPNEIVERSKPVESFDIDNEFCPRCFKGTSIIKCKNCPKCFYTVLPEKINLFGKDYDLALLEKEFRTQTQFTDERLTAKAEDFVFDITCPSCKKILRYTLKEIKII